MRSFATAAGLLLLLVPTNGSAELVGYWKFDDDVLDQSGTGNDGTATNLAYSTDVPGAIGFGKSGDFDNTAYVTIAADASLNSTVFTLAFWVNQDGVSQDAGRDRLTSRDGYDFETSVSDANGISYFPGYAYGWKNTGYSPTSSGWEHLAFVSNGTSMSLYVDGTAVYSGGPAPNSLGGLMRIGAAYTGSELYEGLIDDMALWNQALGPQEIAMLVDGVDARSVPEPATLALFVLGTLALLGARRLTNSAWSNAPFNPTYHAPTEKAI